MNEAGESSSILLMDELPDICLAEVVRLLVSVFAERLLEWTMLAEQEVQEQLEDFLDELPSLLSQKLRKYV